jgi:UDP-N-acetylglucosamine 2-epimerase (non-hydrolysing)
VFNALVERGLAPCVVLTGQHPEIELADHGFDDPREMRLNCPGEIDPHRHVAMVVEALGPLLDPRPELIVVQGDTSSALGGALAGSMGRIPVAHVEAGLRTHDPTQPFPEEEYRLAIDARADLLFAPTELAAANLRSERVRGHIHVTGNTAIDALFAAEARLPPGKPTVRALPRLLVTCHRRENWGQGIASVAAAVLDLAQDGSCEITVVLHPNPKPAQAIAALLGGRPRISLVPPCSHLELIAELRKADLVLSDSGGIQEEAPALGVPLLVLREKTERPEGIASGNALLVGTSSEAILREARRLIGNPLAYAAMARPNLPYGDGHAAPRIAEAIVRWLGVSDVTRRSQSAARFFL